MDVTRYRKRYEAELKKAAASLERERARMQAAGEEPASAADRANAIKAAPIELERLPDRVAELLAILRNRAEPVSVRTAALQALGALDFLGPRFEPYRADYKQALRELATDPQAKLRESALELLAIAKDPYAQKVLVRGLEQPEEALVPDAKAIQFLGYDDHGGFAPLARKVFERSTGPAREQALKLLATDPQSERLLARLLQDKSETSNVRRISASGLQSLNPESFERTARKIVADDKDYDEIRAASLAALAYGREARETPADPKLVETVQKLTAKKRSPAMRSAIERFLRSTQQ